MAQQFNKLTDRKARGHLKPGRHSDGGGLYLYVSETGAKSWLFMWKANGKRREMGLGSFNGVPLARARELAEKARQDRAAGQDPIANRDAPKAKLFSEAADALIASMSSLWRSEKHKAQWEMTIREYCGAINDKRVSEISTDDILEVLTKRWREIPETAARLRGRIERILDYAKARGWRSGENPARWRGHLDSILPKRAKLSRGHHSAMPFDEVPAFINALHKMEGSSALALEFAILTAARSGETLGATWQEIDLPVKIWTIPAGRMKGGREHRVPLSARAMDILKDMALIRTSEFVFPGRYPGRPLTGTALEMVMRREKLSYTPHGFRSSFRDWTGESTTFPREVAEAALAHLVGDQTERAYRRGDALAKRAKLMEAWAAFCLSQKPAGKVIAIARTAKATGATG